MKNTRDKEYLEIFSEQSKKSRISQKYQLIGLMIADLLNDRSHKSLYIKLAKENNIERLLSIAKDVASRKNIERKGAYFMKILQRERSPDDRHAIKRD
mgnify:CR=1 FL=1